MAARAKREFGSEHFHQATALAVAGDELFVCDTGREPFTPETDGMSVLYRWYPRLQVFSLSGEYQREIHLGFGWAENASAILHANGRLYLAAYDTYTIRVVSLEGEDLQLYPVPGRKEQVTCMCIFGERLVVGEGTPSSEQGDLAGGDRPLCVLHGI